MSKKDIQLALLILVWFAACALTVADRYRANQATAQAATQAQQEAQAMTGWQQDSTAWAEEKQERAAAASQGNPRGWHWD